MPKRIVIFDIDGTLADPTHRRHHVANKPKRWDRFFAEQINDPPMQDIVELYQFLAGSGVDIVFCTGRGAEYRADTIVWLRKHVEPSGPIELWMRPAKDSRPDDVIKKEMLDQLRKEGHDIWFVVDDRQRVVDMWRKNGVTVLQCAPGDFDTAEPANYVPKDGERLLTLLVGPSGAGKSTYVAEMLMSGEWRRDEIVSSDQVRDAMFGDFMSQEDNPRVFAFAHDTVKTRLRYGLHTVVDATNLHRKDRLAFVNLLPEGANVEYIVIDRPLDQKLRVGGWRLNVVKDGINLVERHHGVMRSAIKDILKGDGLPNCTVTDTRFH